jgi:uncharacterized membrane protein YqjE
LGIRDMWLGVITIILFDNLYRQVYFVMHTFLVLFNLSFYFWVLYKILHHLHQYPPLC